MSLIEVIGFVISLSALIFLFIKRTRELRFQREHPEEHARLMEQREDALAKLLGPQHHPKNKSQPQHRQHHKPKHENSCYPCRFALHRK